MINTYQIGEEADVRKLLLENRKAQSSAGKNLHLQYFLVIEEFPDGVENYGVQIIELESAAVALAPGITTNAQKVIEFVQILANCTVTPFGLPDVLADWL